MRKILAMVNTSVDGGSIRANSMLKELNQLSGVNTKIFSQFFGSYYSLNGIVKRFLYFYHAFPSATHYFPYPRNNVAKLVNLFSKYTNSKTRFLIDYHEDRVAQLEAFGVRVSSERIKSQKILDELFFNHDQTILLFTTEDFQSAYGAPANSVVIHDGADPDLFKYTPLPSKPIVFYIGSIHEARGIEVLIEAIRIARKEEKSIQLKVYGYGEKEYEEKISKLLSKVGGQFMGKINHDEVPKAIENSFVCINPLITSPYFELGEPIKLFEYMACGRPVIGSNIKQQKRIIESEKCGLVYHDNSPNELAEALLTLIQDPQKAQRYGNNGRKAIEERWSWKENVKRAIPKLMELGAIPQVK